jgi:chromosome segregation ATPase
LTNKTAELEKDLAEKNSIREKLESELNSLKEQSATAADQSELVKAKDEELSKLTASITEMKTKHAKEVEDLTQGMNDLQDKIKDKQLQIE